MGQADTAVGRRRESMGQDPVWRLLSRFSLPAIVSMTVASSYNLVDAVFIGRLGPTALAAMSVSFPLVLSLVAVASGTAVGVTSLIARSLGAGAPAMADRTAAVAISLCFLLSAVVAAVCLPPLDTILRMLGADAAVLPLARGYMRLLIVFNIFAYLSMILANLIRADGNPVFASSVSIASAVLNVLLDPLFIFGLGPIPSMGIKGAAVATVIAQSGATAAHTIYMLAGRTGYTFKAGDFIPRPSLLAAIYRVGTASIARSAAQFVVMGVINATAAAFGVIPLAIVGVLVRIGRFVQMPVLGLGQGLLPLLGYNFGAGKKARVAEMVSKSILAGSVWAAACWLIVMLFPAQVMSAFSGHAGFQQAGASALRLFSLASFSLMLRMAPGFFFQGIGKGLPAMALTVTQNIVFLLIPVLMLPRLLGVTGLWLAFPVSEVLALGFGQFWMTVELRRQGMRLFGWGTNAAGSGPGSR